MSLASVDVSHLPTGIKKTQAIFKWDDPLLIDEQLTEDERLVMEAAKA